jgi:hypothetical protein
MSDIFGESGADGDEMSRLRPISEATADHLLAGGEVDDPAAQDLAQVLAAASAPGRAEELIREDETAVAFAAAHLAAPASHRRRPMIKSMLINALGLKLLAAALATAVAGLAFAASTGVLPSPLHPGPGTKTPGDDGRTSTTPVHPTTTPGALKTSGPQLTGWCSAYLNAGSAEERNKHLTADLIAAAGGVDKVTDYCIALVGSPKAKPSPTGKPIPSAKPEVSASAQPHVSPRRPEPSGRKGRPSMLPSRR